MTPQLIYSRDSSLDSRVSASRQLGDNGALLDRETVDNGALSDRETAQDRGEKMLSNPPTRLIRRLLRGEGSNTDRSSRRFFNVNGLASDIAWKNSLRRRAVNLQGVGGTALFDAIPAIDVL